MNHLEKLDPVAYVRFASVYREFKDVSIFMDEIKKILDTTSDVEEQKEMLRRNHDQLIGRTVTVTDILSSINYLNGLGHGMGTTDDIDHLGNRRIRSVGELLQNQFRIGFSRMERVIRERMTLQSQDQSVITPQALINLSLIHI